MLKDKNILLGITGSIAAYKAAILVRLLIKHGANVKVIMTPLSKEFITPLTLATLSKNPILVDFFNPENGDWNSHVDLGLWADVYLIAPASANTMAKMANGIADNLLLTTYLSARCPVFIAPAMDLDMFLHPATQKNIKTLQSFNNSIIEPSTGELASGLEGKGRMEEPEVVVSELERFFNKTSKKKLHKRLSNKTILITAGPTHEAIDPVRYIANHSSGKMGYAIAEQLAKAGNKVILVSGPTNLNAQHKNIKLVNVKTADEMFDASIKYFPKCHGAILAAAVADFKPASFSKGKIKRKTESISIDLIANKDIAKELGNIKSDKQFMVGFALENENEQKNAQNKLIKKNLDFIVLNSLNDKGAGFAFDTNKITILDKHNKITKFELKSKGEVASDIINYLDSIL